jgi:hypothetical protein
VVLFEGYIFLKNLNVNYLIVNGTVLPTLKRHGGNRVFLESNFQESGKIIWLVVGIERCGRRHCSCKQKLRSNSYEPDYRAVYKFKDVL